MKHPCMDHSKNDKNKHSYYHNDIEYIEDHFRLLDMMIERKQRKDFEGEEFLLEKEDKNFARLINQKWNEIARKRKQSLDQKKSFALDKFVEKYQLQDMEKKIVLFLLYRYFSSDQEDSTGRSILESITVSRLEMMRSRHYLMETGCLRKNQIISCDEIGEDKSILDAEFEIPEEIISVLLGEAPLLSCKEKKNEEEKTYKNYINLYFTLLQQMEQKSQISSLFRSERMSPLSDFFSSLENSTEVSRIQHNMKKTLTSIEEFGPHKENFPIEQVAKEYQLSNEEKLVLLILLEESLGLSESIGGCEGKKILAILSNSENEMIAKRCILYKEGKLRQNHLIETEKTWGGQNILDSEYFLSEKMIRRLLGDLTEGNHLLEDECFEYPDEGQILLTLAPRFSFGDVIISQEKKKMIEIALSQQIHHKLIFETWGLGKKIPYGNALTMLFSGAPGTGKTMMAEAIANRLGKKLLIANYAQIQNMYVGETEKRIVAAFKQAKEQDGVLLWDEADAMFYSREMASHSWEFRDVNLILQELEKFAGVVILTTNRNVVLDRALERRISLKVHFDMPDAKEREQIWKNLIPQEAPLAENMDFTYLAEKYEISGGIIKNAILYAARYAAYSEAGKIYLQDLIKGVEMQTENSWTNTAKIGFGK